MPDSPAPPQDAATGRADSFRTGFDGRRMREYKDLPIYAAPGLHEAAAALLGAAVEPGARVLEFGAGSGAMSLRLDDAGYRVTASDLFAESFRPRHVPFVAADLNGPFAAQWPEGFDAVMALEIVEHLENPRHMLRQIRALLPKGGRLVLSTPNIANPVSQALFLRRGVFQWFRDVDYREQGHITPQSPWMLEKALEEAGFAIRGEQAVSNPFRRVRKLGWRVRLLAPLFALLGGLPPTRRGEVWLVEAEAV
ncbi:class I SAM-dependent methyltransferase [Luteimonas sp. MJ246]|uniref:class I SAM-dependent methyltransferase n=1 Tax=Luteimonas sp. MJ174 TaxID=3129237 RepID=UPI0031BB5850